MDEPMIPERPRCGTPCLKHAHACDRSPRHTGFHRDVQQKGDHTCEWDTPHPKDFPALMAALRSTRAEVERLRAEVAKAREQAAADVEAYSKELMDAAIKQVTKGNDDGFSATLRAAAIGSAATYLRQEAGR